MCRFNRLGRLQPTADGLRGAFPKYRIRDLVRAHAELITRGLGLGGITLAAVIVVLSAQAGGVMRNVTRQMIEIIKLDTAWRGGDYLAKPLEGLSAAGRHYYSSNLIRRYQASSQHDAALTFGANLTRALSRVRARMLVVPCRQDRLLGLESAKLIAQGVRHAEYAEIDSYKGHLAWRPVAGSQESQFVTQQIRSFLLTQSP